jgi:hypothetical protein
MTNPTPCSITVRRSDGFYKSIYCATQGDLSRAGKILLEHYGDQATVERLAALGDIECVTQYVGTTRLISSTHNRDVEFLYVWEGDRWFVNGRDLAEALEAHQKDYDCVHGKETQKPATIPAEAQFWEQAFLKYIPVTAHVDAAIQNADSALAARTKRFGDGGLSAGRYGEL